MKLTKSHLKQLIKEELQAVLKEGSRTLRQCDEKVKAKCLELQAQTKGKKGLKLYYEWNEDRCQCSTFDTMCGMEQVTVRNGKIYRSIETTVGRCA